MSHCATRLLKYGVKSITTDSNRLTLIKGSLVSTSRQVARDQQIKWQFHFGGLISCFWLKFDIYAFFRRNTAATVTLSAAHNNSPSSYRSCHELSMFGTAIEIY